MNNRIYSTLEIKSVDLKKRTVTGIASTPSTDLAGDIVEPEGAVYNLPIPFLWQHKHSEPVGWVVAVKIRNKKIEVVIEVAEIEEEGKLKDRVDEAWQSLKSKLVRGLSIGFKPIESSDIDGTWGQRFTKWAWLELSGVTIPCNTEATIASVKSFDEAQMAALGVKSAETKTAAPPSGVSDDKKNVVVKLKPVEGKEMNIREQIESFEASKKAKETELSGIMQKAGDAGETLDQEQGDAYDALQSEIAAIDKHLDRLVKLEKANVQKALPVEDKTKAVGSTASVVYPVAKAEKPTEPGIKFARYAMCHLAAKGNLQTALELAKNNYPQHEDIIKTIEFQAHGRNIAQTMKAAVEAGTTLDSTWAAPLVDYQNFAGDFVEFLRPQTILGRFGTDGIPALRNIPFNVRIGGQTTGGNGYWTGEGAPKPLTKFDFTATELRWSKIASIAVITNELIRFSNPSAERLVRDALAGAIIERADIDFIDPAKALVANVSPASITNGAANFVSSGTNADAVKADLKALWAPFIAARNPPRNAVYIMDSTTALSLSLMTNALGQLEFPGISMNGGTFMGVPVIVSDYAPSESGGSIVVLVNASDIWLADDGQVTIDASREASLQMLDNPTNNSGTGTATSMVSMFQTNSTAFLAERYINWARRRSSGVAYLTGVNWA